MLWLVILDAHFCSSARCEPSKTNIFILYGERFEDAVKGGSMGPFVGIVADNDTRHAAGVCVHKANGEAILN